MISACASVFLHPIHHESRAESRNWVLFLFTVTIDYMSMFENLQHAKLNLRCVWNIELSKPDTYWEVPYPLKGIRQIQSTADAFAAIREDGSVVTWGDAEWGGDSSAVRDQLHSVRQIQATMYGAFAAIREDGSVVTWGHAEWGGDSSAVRDQLKGVTKIKGTLGAFAAILEDGSVVSWGHKLYGSDSAAVQDQLKGVQDIQVTGAGFAAIREDGSVLCWGNRLRSHTNDFFDAWMHLRAAMTRHAQ